MTVPMDVRLCLGALEAYRAVLIATGAPANQIAAVERKQTALANFIREVEASA